MGGRSRRIESRSAAGKAADRIRISARLGSAFGRPTGVLKSDQLFSLRRLKPVIQTSDHTAYFRLDKGPDLMVS